MTIKSGIQFASVLRQGWTGETQGPIKTVELLALSGGYFEVPHLLMTYVESV